MISFYKLDSAALNVAPSITEYSIPSRSSELFCSNLQEAIESRDVELANRATAEMLATPCKASVQGGHAWTELLTSTHSHHPLLFSEKVVHALEKNNLSGWRSVPIEIAYLTGALKGLSMPTYFQFYPFGRLQFKYVYYERINGEMKPRFSTLEPKNDPRTKGFFMPDGFIPHLRLIPIENSWDGSDFIYSTGSHLFCSRRFVHLAKREDWRNFNFTPIDRLGKCVGDFRDLPWPPEKWYPENHPPSAFSDDPSQ